MEENWKEVNGYPDYLISSCGRVKTKGRKVRYIHAVTKEEHFRNSTERILKQYKTVWGYPFVQLYKDKKWVNLTIHRLVALNFMPNTNNLSDVNHKDGNKFNNTVQNLEWVTSDYNHEHARVNGLLAMGSGVGTSKLNERCILAINKLRKKGWGYREIAELFDVSRPTIFLIVNGKSWKHTALTGTELEVKSLPDNIVRK